jgi:hypothetical protein
MSKKDEYFNESDIITPNEQGKLLKSIKQYAGKEITVGVFSFYCQKGHHKYQISNDGHCGECHGYVDQLIHIGDLQINYEYFSLVRRAKT